MTEAVLMGKTEEWFWDSELRIVWNLIAKKKEIEKARQKNLAIYIAMCVWGKDPNAIDEQEETEVAGRDKPIDPAQLQGLFL